MAPYAATKTAVEVLTSILARELRGRNITVNAVAPGPVATELFFKGKSDELIANITKMSPLERLGKPEDIASVVSFWPARIAPGSTARRSPRMAASSESLKKELEVCKTILITGTSSGFGRGA